MAEWSFDVAVVPAGLDANGRRNLDQRRRWRRVVIAADSLVEAHLAAAQMASCSGMVTDVLYRD